MDQQPLPLTAEQQRYVSDMARVPAGWLPDRWAARLRTLAGIVTSPDQAALIAVAADRVEAEFKPEEPTY